MNGKYNIWNKWDPLKTVMLGDCYGPEFFRDIKNSKIRSALVQIAEETQEDLANYEKILKDFGCEVLRPVLDNNDNIMNYVDINGTIQGLQGVPRSPLQPRDCQLVIGNELFYTKSDHISIKQALDQYNNEFSFVSGPLNEKSFINIRGEEAPNWPTYSEYRDRYFTGQPISEIESVIEEFNQIHSGLRGFNFSVDAPSITVVGKDIYLDFKFNGMYDNLLHNFYMNAFKEKYLNFRHNELNIGGHSDGCFHTLKPGVIISLKEIQIYENTFPNWEVCYLPDQSWAKIDGFLKIKDKVAGKWWVPEQEDNAEFTHFVETWLQDWVGYVEETVFDVNVLVLDEHHVCVNNMNPDVIKFLKKHNMEPVHVPWRHRYFWDGGLHCITLDLYREGKQQNYFPQRKNPIVDLGFE